jgi:hypothetical protein
MVVTKPLTKRVSVATSVTKHAVSRHTYCAECYAIRSVSMDAPRAAKLDAHLFKASLWTTTPAAAAQACASLIPRESVGVGSAGMARKCVAPVCTRLLSRGPPPHCQRSKHRKNERKRACDHSERIQRAIHQQAENQRRNSKAHIEA